MSAAGPSTRGAAGSPLIAAGAPSVRPAPPALAVRELTVVFDRPDAPPLPAVRGVSFTLHRGQTVAIVGESGSGKSVTALATLGLLPTPPARVVSGAALVATDRGVVDTLAASDREVRAIRGRVVSVIFQEPMTALNPVLTIGAQLVEAIRAHRDIPRREALERAASALEGVGFTDPRARLRAYPHELSGGMRQRALLAMALATEPRTLIADEPTTALDSATQRRMLHLLHEARERRGLALLLITHSLSLVAAQADVVCVMWSGRVVEYGRTAEVIESPMHPYTRALLAARPALWAVRPRLGAPPPEPEPIAEAGGAPAWAPGASHGEHRLLRVAPARWVGVSIERDASSAMHEPPDISPGEPAAPAAHITGAG